MKEKLGVQKDFPPEKCPRAYRMGQRETAMEETRTRVLVSARDQILSENALAGFSMEAVAQRAGITRVTIYHRFGSKRGLLEALFDEMGLRGRLNEKLPQVFARPHALEAMRAYIEVFCDFWESERVMNRRLRAFSVLDKEFATAIASRHERRHHAIEILLRRLDQDLSTDKTRFSSAQHEELLQTLLALTGFEFYDALAGERNPQEIALIIFQLVQAALGP